MKQPSNADNLAELARVKALFQLRAIKAAIGLPATTKDHSDAD